MYDTNEEFNTKSLLRIMTEDLVKWMNYRAYEKENPDENDRPIYCRSNIAVL